MAIAKVQRERMLDYLVEKLRGNGEVVTPRKHQFIPGENSRLIYVGSDGLVLLCDKTFTEDTFSRAINGIRQGFQRSAAIFYKDGETYFRSGAKRRAENSRYDQSLKLYNDQEIQHMILFTPAEEIIRRSNLTVQYYQPDSARLEEGVRTFKYEPVILDYSHLPAEIRPCQARVESEKLRIWTGGILEKGDLMLDSNALVPR